jgi:hypothetical protein
LLYESDRAKQKSGQEREERKNCNEHMDERTRTNNPKPSKLEGRERQESEQGGSGYGNKTLAIPGLLGSALRQNFW